LILLQAIKIERDGHGIGSVPDFASRRGVGVLHEGDVRNRYVTKEVAFEAAVAAASLAIREGHEVHISVPDRSSGNQTALGAKNPD
jgi:hypothetical protein